MGKVFPFDRADLSADVPLAAFLRRVSRIVEKRFDETGEVPPSWALVTAGGKAHLVVTPFPATAEDPCGDNAKKAGVALMHDYFREHDVVRFEFVAEGWQGTKPASVRPVLDPNRTEVVVLIAEDRGGAITAAREIIRLANGKSYLGKLEVNYAPHTPGHSRFGNLLYHPRPRSSDELPDDEGTVFVTNVPDAPFQIVGRRGPTGELFVGGLTMPRDGRTMLSPEELARSPVIAGEEGQKLISDVVRWLPKN
jgi:hypothetical protein